MTDGASGRPPDSSPWEPLREPLFRALWIAAFVSNLGAWMQDVGEAWLMTSLTRSALLVSLLQTAEGIAVFLLALPAGALADIVDRRRLLIVTQAWSCAVAAAVGIVTLTGHATPALLIAGGFGVGLGTALTAPSWQAIVGDVVPRSRLAAAVTLNGVGFNLARALGPAIGGLIVAAVGPGPVFLLNAASFLAIVAVLWHWKREPRPSALPGERVWGAVRAGLRYVRHAPELAAVLVRTIAFLGCAISVLALLPLLARHGLGLSALGYGLLLGCYGGGAIASAFALDRLRARLSVNVLVLAAAAAFAIGEGLAAWLPPALAGFGLFLCGFAWLAGLSAFQVTTQTAVPPWVRGRALSTYLLASFGAIAVGSVLWGSFAGLYGVRAALSVAAALLVLGQAGLSHGWVLRAAPEEQTVIAEGYWPAPALGAALDDEAGPILVSVLFEVEPAREAEFLRAAAELGRFRRRSGAMRWGLFRDTLVPTRHSERYLVESWAEHLRQHERGTFADRAIEDRVRGLVRAGTKPVVTHEVFEPVARRPANE